jgi:hypothetical protein
MDGHKYVYNRRQLSVERWSRARLTDVVLTPQSWKFSNWGVGALGVSMNSKSLSEPLALWTLDAMVLGSLNWAQKVNG